MEELNDKDFAKMFEKHIKMLRKRHELSQSELARRAELEKTAIQRIERGYNSTLKTLRKIAKGFDISLSDLFKLNERKA
ncbi:MAG: helix-turn-helix domain-containing protein [Flavobacteriaceae bacterium]|nr:MAG: helix-turn-helix domain-containing protein [Flavobacteriaceae bacterium]